MQAAKASSTLLRSQRSPHHSGAQKALAALSPAVIFHSSIKHFIKQKSPPWVYNSLSSHRHTTRIQQKGRCVHEFQGTQFGRGGDPHLNPWRGWRFESPTHGNDSSLQVLPSLAGKKWEQPALQAPFLSPGCWYSQSQGERTQGGHRTSLSMRLTVPSWKTGLFWNYAIGVCMLFL